MNVGDKVKRNNVMEFEGVYGTVIEMTRDYFVVRWEKNRGKWKYSHERSDHIEVVDEAG